jgi:type IV pilus assembly protein PilA
MINTLRKRLRNEEKGFTLIELLVVVIILGILTAIAIPSYLSFTGRAHNAANKANVRSIVPSIESYFADNQTYSGMSLAALKSTYDQALNASNYLLTGVTPTSYCVQSPQATGGSNTFFKNGPAADIASGDCP